MSDPRYPIGEFEPPGSLTPDQRATAIAGIAGLPAAIHEAVRGLGREQLDTPYRVGGWTVRQVVHHLADSHANAQVRTRLLLTEDNPTIRPYDERAWAELSDAANGAIGSSLMLLSALHERWVHCLRDQPPGAFARALVHPESGSMTLDDVVASYDWHGRHHTAHVTELRKARGW